MAGEDRGHPLRVVIDPNVFVSAAISHGASRRITEVAAAGGFQMIACPRLLDELHRVLQREKFLKYRSREQLDRFVRDIELLVVVKPDPESIEPVTRDPDDDYLVALARQHSANRICTGDHDFDDVTWPTVTTPGELLRHLASGD